jgi:hypothetical protein
MKPKHRPLTNGSALIVTLCTAAIIAVMVATYMGLLAYQNWSVSRSHAWNDSIPVLESGIEEALTQVHYNGPVNLATNGWTLGADGLYHKTRTFSDGSYYSVNIQPTNPPVIVSTGYVLVPVSSGSDYVSRKVRVTTRKPSVGSGGLNAKGQILFSGGGSLDSFNSADPLYSTNGRYDPTKREANGTALTDSSMVDGVHVDTAHIYGSATTGPGGTVTVNSGAVGDLAYNLSSSGIQAGHAANNANVQFNDVAAPFVYSTGTTPASGTVAGTNYTYVAGVNIGGGKSLLVTGNAVLYVNGDMTVGGSGYIYLAPASSLQIYISGTGTFSGTGIVNGTGLAANLSLYGLPTCATMTVSGSAAFIGTVYAPEAAFTFSGSAGASGSFTGSTVTISGGASVHYDEGLASAGQGYVVASWNEL